MHPVNQILCVTYDGGCNSKFENLIYVMMHFEQEKSKVQLVFKIQKASAKTFFISLINVEAYLICYHICL